MARPLCFLVQGVGNCAPPFDAAAKQRVRVASCQSARLRPGWPPSGRASRCRQLRLPSLLAINGCETGREETFQVSLQANALMTQASIDDGSIPQSAGKKRILILGGGFAGAYAARYLEKRLGATSDIEIVVIAKENFVLFTPMLHEVAGSDVSLTDIVQPLRKMVRRAHVGIAEIEAIDLAQKQVRIRHHYLTRPYDVSYDQLVLAHEDAG
jgi:hypothetical protein